MSTDYRRPDKVKKGDLVKHPDWPRAGWVKVTSIRKSGRNYIIRTERGPITIESYATIDVRIPCQGCNDFLGRCEGTFSCPGSY